MRNIKKLAFALAAILLALTLPAQTQGQEKPEPPASQSAQPQSPPQRVRVSATTLRQMIVTRVDPRLTKEQDKERKKKRIQGLVQLLVVITTSGDISEVTVINGDPLLANACVDAVKRWKFHPYLLKGSPVEVETTLAFNFPLND
ncbi:MAG: energy transducer TonB, partial [Terriglobales bacterium]